MQYEYKTLVVKHDEVSGLCQGLTAKLNQAGKQEWELVSIVSQNGLGSAPYNMFGITQKQLLVFKRATAAEVSP